MTSFLMFEGNHITTSANTIMFVRQVFEKTPEHRANLFKRLCQIFDDIRGFPVIRIAVWILGEYAESKDEVDLAFDTIKNAFGSTPIASIVNQGEEDAKEASVAGK